MNQSRFQDILSRARFSLVVSSARSVRHTGCLCVSCRLGGPKARNSRALQARGEIGQMEWRRIERGGEGGANKEPEARAEGMEGGKRGGTEIA